MSDHPSTSPQEVDFKKFLEKSPPGKTTSVSDVAAHMKNRISSLFLVLPVLEIHCDSGSCAGMRLFHPIAQGHEREFVPNIWKDFFLQYQCRNCRETKKTFAVAVLCEESPAELLNGLVYKYGELPPFGPPTPARVITMLGPEKEYYLKGRRAENQGMGIAAFAYYRRVVENQKNRLFDEIIRVAEQIGAPGEMIEDLNEAKRQTQFSKAVDVVKHGIPSALLVRGHNPLKLLHAALSEGLHDQTDEKCLEIATSIRAVLSDLADNLGHALKQRAALHQAVTRLLK